MCVGVRHLCLEVNHIHVRAVVIPAGCTGELQPLDISVNDVFNCFSHWYMNEVSTALSNGVGVEGVSVDLCISIVKPIHANWLSNVHVLSKLKVQRARVQRGFEKKNGIASCFNLM